MNTTTKVPDWLVLDTGSHEDTCGVCLEECLALLLDQEKTFVGGEGGHAEQGVRCSTSPSCSS